MFTNRIVTGKMNLDKTTTTFGQKILLFLLGLCLLIILEICLRLFGAFPVHKIGDPFLDFQGERPLFIPIQSQGETVYVTNPGKSKFFNLQQFPAEKLKRTFRVFCLGGSTTYGRPFKAATSFPAWLKILLDKIEPERSHEVINAGGISYASYRIVHLMREIANCQPDLFIVYTGHNEFLETITYANLLNRPPILKYVVNTLDKTRIYRLSSITIDYLRKAVMKKKSAGLPEEVEANLDRIGGFELYKRDEKLKRRILEQFRYNVNRMIDISREINVPILFIDPMSNLSDFSPFKSESTDALNPETARMVAHQRELAIVEMKLGNFDQAKTILDKTIVLDVDFALGRYLRAQCMEQLGQIKESLNEYQMAIDQDVCPLRAIGEIRTIIKEATQNRGIPLLSVDSVFVAQCKNGLLGNEMFIDHVHPTTTGHQFIARRILKYLIESGIVQPSHNLGKDELYFFYQSHMRTLDNVYFAKGNLNLGKVLVWARKHAEALGPLQAAADDLAENVEAQRLLANTYHRVGQSESAVQAYQRVLTLLPGDAQSWDNLCDVELHLGHKRRAIRAGKKATTFAPKIAQYHATLGDAYFQTRLIDNALDSYQRAVRLDSTDAAILNNLGRTHFFLDNTTGAIRAFQSAVRLNPTYTLAYKNLGKCYSSLGEHDLASAAYRQALELSPFDIQLHNMTGIAYLRGGQLSLAVRAFHNVLNIDSTFVEAYQNLGTAYTLAGKPDSGLYNFELALSHCPTKDNRTKGEILANLGNSAVLVGDLSRAILVWQKCIKIFPQNVKLLYKLAFMLIKKNESESAIVYLKRAQALQPKNRKILILLGESLIKLNRKEEAREYFEKVEEIEKINQ